MIVAGIYKITSPTGRIYIGQSYDIYRRWRYHKNQNKGQYPLQRSFAKHGYLNHRFEVIHELPLNTTRELINTYEVFYIKAYMDAGFCLLNLTPGGEGGRGYKHTDKSKKKMSELAKKRGVSKELINKLHENNKGKPRTEEVKQKIRSTKLGVKHTPEMINNWLKSFDGKWKANKGSFQVGNGAKLSKQQANEIRLKYKPYVYTFRMLAIEYHIDNKSVRGIVNKVTKCYL